MSAGIRRRNLSLDAIDAGVGGLITYKWYAPPVGTNTYISTAADLVVGTNQSVTLAAQSLDNGVTQYCRNVTVTRPADANSSVTSCTVRVFGRDKWKNRVMETIVAPANATTAGNVAFSYIDAIKYDCTGTVDAGVDTISIGTGAKLGLPVKIGASTDIIRFLKHLTDAAVDSAPVAETVAAVSTTYHTITMTTTLAAGTNDYSVEILSTYDLAGIRART